MLVFLAMPYTKLCDEKSILKDEYKGFFIKLTEEIKKMGHNYFLAVERENWGKEYISAKESTNIDYNTIKECDLMCVLPGIPHSGGVHVEMGWASAHNKKMNIFLSTKNSYSPMVTGIECLTDAVYYYYNDEYSDELVDVIIASIKERLEDKKSDK